MNIHNLKSIAALKAFLAGSTEVAYSVAGNKRERYAQITKLLKRYDYHALKRDERGTLIAFLVKITGLSRQQVTRLVKQYREKGEVKHRPETANGFKKKYTSQDIVLLAQLDERHGTLNGKATKKLIARAYDVHGQSEYQSLRTISVSHIYNVRRGKKYCAHRRHFTKTRYKASSIGERRPPTENGKPGYIRIDTVHQGDLDRKKGVYHINAVDTKTQFQVIASVEKISEAYLLPALNEIIAQLPFTVLGFHSDNGSEYINKSVATLLDKLRIEMTKSRPRHSNDNALVESKNGAVVRKQFGYAHIPQRYAAEINVFNKTHLNPYLNYHRPCLFPKIQTDDKGKQRRTYPYENMMTPYEKLKSLENAQQYLKADITIEKLDSIAGQVTDDTAADRLNEARNLLFKQIMNQAS